MAQEFDYKAAFEWVCEQIDKELSWTNDDISELNNKELSERSSEYDRLNRLQGSRFAYESIKRLCDNLKKHGVDGYDKQCKETCERYSKI